MTADPREVSAARPIDQLSYEEAAELAYFGGNILHPLTMQPCVSRKIPIVIRNTFDFSSSGTLIVDKPCNLWRFPCKAFTKIPATVLVNVEGAALLGVKGTAAKVFAAVYAADVNVVMITQASSEHSITFAVLKADAEKCMRKLREVFLYEVAEGAVHIAIDPEDTAILTAVGDNMKQQPGLLGRLATALGNAGVSVKAVAQGASERNITFVVAAHKANLGLLAMHQEILQ
jgi:aspartokinase/homoserine dehydrogenase 1